MAAISLALGILGNIISILVFSAPLSTFWRIFKRKSTENFRGLPYICTLLSTSLWSYYGLIKPGGTLVLTINAAGCVLQGFYLTVFLIYAPRARKVRTGLLAFLLNGVCFGLILVSTLTATKGQMRVFVLGAICSAISVSMYASPLGIMRMVIRTKSVEFMPFFLSLFLFLNGGVWATYALVVKDVFIEIPNAIGFVLGGVQLALYIFYKNRKPRKLDDKKENSDAIKESQDLEMGRTMSLPILQQPSFPRQASLPKQNSLPVQILKTSSSKVTELLKFFQDIEMVGIKEDDHQGNVKH